PVGPAAPAPPARPSPPPPRDVPDRHSEARGATPVWQGRFASGPAEVANVFTRDTADRRLIVPDLLSTRAHVGALHRAGLLTDEELAELVAEVDSLLERARAGEFPFDDADEDVHVAVERVLAERLGSLGARVH